MSDIQVSFGSDDAAAAAALITLALAEDLGERGDITSNSLIPEDETGRVRIVARQPGVVCGVPIGREILHRVDASAEWTTQIDDARTVGPGAVVATLSGRVRGLLTAERTILNFMTHLSGVASLTRQYVAATEGTRAVILDTRKTLPGWRLLQKYAVRCGGGHNHRMGLWDAVLIKDNHLAALAQEGMTSLSEVVRIAREHVPNDIPITIEVDTLSQLRDALCGSPEVILLDNMNGDRLQEAVSIRDGIAPAVLLEASGGVNLQTVREISFGGVDRISIGALTHSAPSLDLGFDWDDQGA